MYDVNWTYTRRLPNVLRPVLRSKRSISKEIVKIKARFHWIVIVDGNIRDVRESGELSQ